MDFALVLAIIVVLVVLFFGVRRLPHLARSLVTAVGEFGRDAAAHHAHHPATTPLPAPSAEPAAGAGGQAPEGPADPG